MTTYNSVEKIETKKITTMGGNEFLFSFTNGHHAYWSGWKNCAGNGCKCLILSKDELMDTITSTTIVEEAFSATKKTLEGFYDRINQK